MHLSRPTRIVLAHSFANTDRLHKPGLWRADRPGRWRADRPNGDAGDRSVDEDRPGGAGLVTDQMELVS